MATEVVNLKYKLEQIYKIELPIALEIHNESIKLKDMDSNDRYNQLYSKYEKFASIHPIVFKTSTKELLFSKKSFKLYLRSLIGKGDIKLGIQEQMELGAKYLSFLTAEDYKHLGPKERSTAESYYLKSMKEDIESVNKKIKEKGQDIKERFRDAEEKNKQELYEYILKLKKESESSSTINSSS